MITDQLLKKYPIISDQVDVNELRVILMELEKQLQQKLHGNVVELGCYTGTTSLFIRRLLDAYDFTGEYHVYDSFAGLPPKTPEDMSVAGDQFKAGELYAQRKEFQMNFKKAGLTLPKIHKAWFSEMTPDDLPREIMFAFFDGDFYESIKDSFRVTEPNLANDARIIVDDYANEALPGAAIATNEWMQSHQRSLRVQSSLAVIR